MDNERIWTLIAKKLAGEATAEDILELYDLLQEHPEVHYSLEIFDELWEQNQFAKDRPVAAYARLLKKMEQQGIEFPAGKRLSLQQRIHATPRSLNEKAKKKLWPTVVSTGQMITNNVKVTCRKLLRNRTNSLVNITGLAIGMAASILILLWIFDELSFEL